MSKTRGKAAPTHPPAGQHGPGTPTRRGKRAAREVKRLAGQGMGLLVISDDIPELLQSCNRLLLMRKGRIVEELLPEKTHENELAAKLIEA